MAPQFIIRNDDVNFDTDINEIRTFCEICDRYGYKIIQAITLLGECRKARNFMGNEEIRLSSFKRFEENGEVVKYLKSRNDMVGVHGLWHTHEPSGEEIKKGKELLTSFGFNPTYFVPPFNEGSYPESVEGLTTCKLSLQDGDNLETFLNEGTPKSAIMYLHSWRFATHKFGCSFEKLDACLARLNASPFRLWYNDWIRNNVNKSFKVLDVGKSKYWDYGFYTIDTDAKMNPTFVGDIQKTDFPSETFDMVLCNGMYEFVENPQVMVDEVMRIVKKGGKAMFGFVGPDYKPYRKPWRFFEGKEKLPDHMRVDFGKEYSFLICSKN